MSQQRYQQLLMERTHKLTPWDSAPAKYIVIEDLDHNEIFNVVSDGIRRGRIEARLETDDPLEALRRLKLTVNGDITNAAGVLFCNDSAQYYPQCLLRLVRFKGVTKSKSIDSRRINGHAFNLLAEAEDFVIRHMSIESEFVPGKMARNDIPDYPLRAVREAMVNALCHRDYSIQNGSISLMIYDDRLEITSHGTLPIGISVEELKRTHESLPRNVRITDVMYRRWVIESVGTGTQEMVKECLSIGNAEPEFLERGNTFVVCFRPKDIKKILEEMSERQRNIFALLLECGELSSSELVDKLEQRVTVRTLRRDLNYLADLGLVSFKGSGPSIIWYLTSGKN